LANLYGHIGVNAREETKEQNEELLIEVFRTCELYHSSVPVFVAGTLNTEWSASQCLTDYERRGWFDVFKVFSRQTNTFWSTEEDFNVGRGSILDYIIASPSAIKLVRDVEVGSTRNIVGHTELHIDINCDAYSRNTPRTKISKAYSPVKFSKLSKETISNAPRDVEEEMELLRSIIQEGNIQDS
jgi:hypothetical protein